MFLYNQQLYSHQHILLVWVLRNINELIEMDLPDVAIIPDDDNILNVLIIIKADRRKARRRKRQRDVYVTIKMPMNYPLDLHIYHMLIIMINVMDIISVIGIQLWDLNLLYLI